MKVTIEGIGMSLLEKFERYPLTFGPTPIEHLPRLSAALGNKVQIYAKREDCNSGLAMGGNKLRKLEYIIPDAIASGADTLVSIGGVQSNHTRMVAATAAKIGMKCVVIQERWVPHHDAVYDRVGNILMTRLMGADSRLVHDGFDIGIRKSWEDAIRSVKDAGGKPYPIPAGASVHKYGGLGYVGFAEEVARQEEQLGFAFDYIIVCVVTGSTQAGMIVGFAAQDRADKVIGIDASGTLEQTRSQVRRIVDDTASLVGLGRSVRDEEIVIKPDYAYPAYGIPSEATNDAIRLAARTEAMITDPVYEGKSMQGLVDLTRKGFFAEGSKVLYAHLGGAPAINGYSSYYKDDGANPVNTPLKDQSSATERDQGPNITDYPPMFP
jgi:1-aminocyclopropane-1-carboxylate deaminase